MNCPYCRQPITKLCAHLAECSATAQLDPRTKDARSLHSINGRQARWPNDRAAAKRRYARRKREGKQLRSYTRRGAMHYAPRRKSS